MIQRATRVHTSRHKSRKRCTAAATLLAVFAATVGLIAPASPATADDVAVFNFTSIFVPAPVATDQQGTGSPYPSSITVAGASGTVSDVDVTLDAVAHPTASDLDVLLVGPQGQNLVLMSDVANAARYAVSGTVTFDDDAASTIPASGVVLTGSFRPTNSADGVDTFPAPAPAPSPATALSVFDGTDPNGTWSLYVVDDAPGGAGLISGGWTLSVTTTPPPPIVIADAGGPYVIDEGDDLTLDATGTTAEPTATYAWDLDDDGDHDDATGATPTIPLADLGPLGLDDGPAGPDTISVQVTDGPTVATATSTVTVTNIAPTAGLTAPGTLEAGTAATFDLTATDPSPVDQAADVTYDIDWGDGTPAQSLVGPAATTADHTYTTPGTYEVAVTATDKDGATGPAATVTVTVDAPPPVVIADAGGPYVIDEGDDLTLDATGTTAEPTATYAWDLDDDGDHDDATGATPTIPLADLGPLGLDDGPTGPDTISVQVTDGPTVDTATSTVTVTNIAPTATIDPPNNVVAGTPATFGFAATDPSPVDQAADFTYTIDWGDGTPTEVVSGPADTTVQHTYAVPARRTVTVTVTDKDGAVGPATMNTGQVAPWWFPWWPWWLLFNYPG